MPERIPLTSVPDPPLGDDRVSLRPWAPEDALSLAPLCGDPAVCRGTTVPWAYTPEAAGEWISRQAAKHRAREAIVLAVVPEGTREPVGTVTLNGFVWPESTARLGYFLRADARGRGLGSAAARLLAGWGLTELPLDRLELHVEPANLASRRVAEGLGATATGCIERTVRGASMVLVVHTLTLPLAPPPPATRG